MPAVDDLELEEWHIFLKRVGTLNRMDRIVLAPEHERGRLVLSKPLLEPRIQLEIRPIVAEEIERCVCAAGEETTERIPVAVRVLLPESLDRQPERTQS